MTSLLHILGFALIILSPFCMGLPWISVGGANSNIAKVCFAYVAGYFIRHTLFHWIAMPMTLLGMHFSTMANVFTIALLILCSLSVYKGYNNVEKSKEKARITRRELIYLIAFLVIVGIQFYIAIFMDPTTSTYDDSAYTVYSNDALASDYMMQTNPYTGVFTRITHRFIQSSVLFPAYISRLTGMPVTMTDRTFNYALNILMAYCCYTYMADDLYEEREKRILFLAIVSLLYLFGYHSHYSMTFRLLGPNSQGKAVLAVILVPLLLVLLRKKMTQSYEKKTGVLFLLFSDAACSLSLMGVGYAPCLIGMLTILSMFRKERQWKHLLYLLWGCTLPALYMVIFLFMRYYV